MKEIFAKLQKETITASDDFKAVMAYSTSGADRHLQNAVQLIQDLFNIAKVNYAIGGALALGFYAKPRTTNDVDVFTSPVTIRKVLQTMNQMGLSYIKESNSQYIIPKTEIHSEFDILLDVDDAFQELLYKPNVGILFGLKVNIARPEGLLWNYLISITDNLDEAKKAQHTADAINLIRSGKVNMRALLSELQASDPYLIGLLGQLRTKASTSGSYGSTRVNMNKRLRNQQQ
jgi:hypothetical protein